MRFEQDWFMRQTELLTELISGIMLEGREAVYKINDYTELSLSDSMYIKLNELLAEGNICGAEDQLYEEIDTEDEGYLLLAIDFYRRLNELTDKDLENKNFSREEVYEGLKTAAKKFGVPDLGL